MKHRFRARGYAAASLALVATTAFAGPTAATRTAAGPAMIVADHATATVADDRTMERLVGADTGTESGGRGAKRTPTAPAKGADRDAAKSIAAHRALRSLVRSHAASDVSDPERECLAAAVYFEAQSEPVEGQLAVAEVVLNRTASGEYPRSICEVVMQPAQFSFVRDGRVPDIDKGSEAWRKAVAVADIAAGHLAGTLSPDVLWYHADYVAPGWGRRLDRVTQIGAHIFYRRA